MLNSKSLLQIIRPKFPFLHGALMKKALTVSLLFVTLLFFEITIGTSASAESIRVGVLLPLTGKLAGFGQIERKSFLMALHEFNAAGGVNGEKIHLIIEDTAGKPDVGRSAIEKLIVRDNVCIVGGGVSSSVTWEAVKFSQQHKVPFLVNTASADKISEKGGNYVFRLNPPVSEYLDAQNSFLTNVARVKTVAILYENTPFGQSKAREFSKKCKELGFKIVEKKCYKVGTVDFGRLLISINEKEPDLFYMISSSAGTEPSLIVRQAKDMNLNAKILVGDATGFTLSEFYENAGDASDYVFAATLWTPSVQYPGASDYYNTFVAKYNEPPEYHGAQSYAAMYVIADALKRAKSLSPPDVRDALAETDMMTVFGPVRFISYGKKKQQNKVSTFLGQWINGEFEAVWPSKLVTVKYIYPITYGRKITTGYP